MQRRRQLPAETVLLIGEAETLSYEEPQGEFGRLLHGESSTEISIVSSFSGRKVA